MGIPPSDVSPNPAVHLSNCHFYGGETMPCEHHPCSLGDELEEWHAGFGGGGRRHVGPSSLPTACGLWKQNHRSPNVTDASMILDAALRSRMFPDVPGSRSLAARFRKRPASWAACGGATVQPRCGSTVTSDWCLCSLEKIPPQLALHALIRHPNSVSNCTDHSLVREVQKKEFLHFLLTKVWRVWYMSLRLTPNFLCARSLPTKSYDCQWVLFGGNLTSFPREKTVNNRILYCHATWRHGDGVAWCLSHRRSFGGSSGHFSADP